MLHRRVDDRVRRRLLGSFAASVHYICNFGNRLPAASSASPLPAEATRSHNSPWASNPRARSRQPTPRVFAHACFCHRVCGRHRSWNHVLARRLPGRRRAARHHSQCGRRPLDAQRRVSRSGGGGHRQGGGPRPRVRTGAGRAVPQTRYGAGRVSRSGTRRMVPAGSPASPDSAQAEAGRGTGPGSAPPTPW